MLLLCKVICKHLLTTINKAMEDKSNISINQDEKYKYGEIIRITTPLKNKLAKIREATGKTQNRVNEEIISLGLRAYNKKKRSL
jgi:hypothetical protein